MKSFWYSKKAMLKQFLFVLALFAILIPVAIWDSNTQVKISYYDEEMYAKSDRYSLSVPYDMIEQVELTPLAELGEEVADGWEDDIIRTGNWKNDTWGEYFIVADMDADNCVLITLNDGRLFVVSRKDNAATEEIYNTLLTKLPGA